MAGESPGPRVDIEAHTVSIHARQQWRANPAPASAYSRMTDGFNPRPPAMAGESVLSRSLNSTIVVSIHARQQWRANRCRRECARHGQSVSIHARQQWRANRRPAGPRCGFRTSFNPRPPAMAGESRAHWPCRQIQWFQSTPASNGGRITVFNNRSTLRPMFQSTPASNGGRIWTATPPPAASACFNPRPPAMAGESRACARPSSC